jgi:hypothetical protein
LEIDGAIADSTLIDYDNQTYYLMVPQSFDLSHCKLRFELSANATADLSSGSILDFRNGPRTVHVMSEDSLRSKQWTIVVDKSISTGLSKEQKPVAGPLVYPNPAGDVVFIKSNGATTYTFLDAFGRSCLSGKIPSSTDAVNTSALPVGIYFLTLEYQNGERKTIKVLIQR